MTELPKPNMDLNELESTMEFISQCEDEGVDCTALREYIKPIITKRVNLDDIND
jgi:hypothetical protein